MISKTALKRLALPAPILVLTSVAIGGLTISIDPSLDLIKVVLLNLSGYIFLGLVGLLVYSFIEVRRRTRSLLEQQARFEASINNLNVGFIVTDLLGEIVTINPAAKRILCISANALSPAILKSTSLYNLNCTMTDIEQQLKTTFDLRAQIAECLTKKKTIDVGEIAFRGLFLRIFITPVVVLESKKSLGLEFIGTVVLVEDITQEKLLEKSKEDFFSIASHELRTPLTAIRGNTSMIKQYYQDKISDPSFREMIDDIHASSVRLIDIVSDFLDVSRLEQGRMKFKKEQFDIEQLIQSVSRDFEGLAAEKKLYLKSETEKPFMPQVLADKDRTRQVLFNLIGNALKFTENGGVTVKVVSEKPVNNLSKPNIKVLVADTGIGVSTQNQQLLFRKFEQAGEKPLTRDATRGTGVGLYISKLMVEGMGGQIKLESSEIGKGTIFGFTLPVADTALSYEIPSTASSSSLNYQHYLQGNQVEEKALAPTV